MVDIKHLTAGYENFRLHDISLQIDKGSIVGILGPNGSGKTTLALTLLGFTKIFSGNISIDSKPYTPKIARQHIAMLMQTPDNMLFTRTVFEEVALALYKRNIPKHTIPQVVEHLLKSVGMQHKIHTPINTLSYGEKKRVAMATIMSMDKPYIILDEPFAGLDLSGRKQSEDIIMYLQKQDKGIILISHDVYSLTMAQIVYVLYHGRVVKQFSQTQFREVLPTLHKWNIWTAN